jgi:hypothetical protein
MLRRKSAKQKPKKIFISYSVSNANLIEKIDKYLSRF